MINKEPCGTTTDILFHLNSLKWNWGRHRRNNSSNKFNPISDVLPTHNSYHRWFCGSQTMISFWVGSFGMIGNRISDSRSLESNHCASKEPLNPLSTRIRCFLWCAVVRVMSDHWSFFGSPQRNAPFVYKMTNWDNLKQNFVSFNNIFFASVNLKGFFPLTANAV